MHTRTFARILPPLPPSCACRDVAHAHKQVTIDKPVQHAHKSRAFVAMHKRALSIFGQARLRADARTEKNAHTYARTNMCLQTPTQEWASRDCSQTQIQLILECSRGDIQKYVCVSSLRPGDSCARPARMCA